MRGLFTIVAILASAKQAIQACNSGESLVVKVVAIYEPPSSFSLSSPFYKAASALSLSCEVEGVDEVGILYQWSTTSSGNCFVRDETTQIAFTNHLHSYDSGDHTCTVYDTHGCTGNASITVKVVGAGVYVESTDMIVTNNSLITTTSWWKIPSFRCVSGSLRSRIGRLIDPLGKDITFTMDPFIITRGGLHDPGTLYVRSLRELEPANSGIYTYRTPDENGNIVDINFGLYLYTNLTTTAPVVSDFLFSITERPFTFSCLSSLSPPTEVIWEKDGEVINSSSNDYHFTQTILNRITSTYDNTLVFNGTIEDVVGEYSCTVVNSLGKSNTLTKSVKVLEVSGHEDPLIVGLSRRINCTTNLNVTRIEWLLLGLPNPVEERDDGEQELVMTVNPKNTDLDGAMFTCKVTITSGEKFEETVTFQVKEREHHSMSITGPPNPLLAGETYSLNCVVTSDFTSTVKWQDLNTQEVITTAGTSVRTGNPVTNGSTTHLALYFDPIYTSHGGTYACISAVSKTGSLRRETRHIQVQIATTSVNIVRTPSTQTAFLSERLDLTCITVLSPYVDTPVQVTHYWEGPSGVVTRGNGIIISKVTGFNLRYSSTLTFSSLRLSDSGIYTCTSTVKATDSLSVTSSSIESNFTSFNTAMRVIIEITYSPFNHDPNYSPPNYRAATSVTLRCVAIGATGYVSYRWSSTCRYSNCFAYSTTAQTISENILRSRDAGVHTCTVTDGAGNTGTNSTIMNIVGAGIYVTYSLGTGTSVNSQTAQPNNSYAIVDTAGSNRGSYTRFEMYCCSNSSSSRATFTLPNNVVISSNYGNIRYRRYTGSNTYAGCARFYYYYYPYDNFYLDYTGIYTCNIGDSRGNNIAVSIGLYSEGFNTPPSIYRSYKVRNPGNHNILVKLIYEFRNVPPTNINWFRNNKILGIDGNSTKMSVSVTNRRSSYFNITLDIICDSPDNVVGIYRLQVTNQFGMDSSTAIEIQGSQIQCSSNEFIIGEHVVCSCSSHLDPMLIEWYQESTRLSQWYYSTEASITIPVTTDDEGSVYTCLVTSSCGTQQEMVTLNTKVPDLWADINIVSTSRSDALHGSEYTLLCTVRPITGMTLPPSIEWIGPDGTVLVSSGNVTVGEMETEGRVHTLYLSFHPVLSSQGGLYTCKATVNVPWMKDQPDQISTRFNMPVTTQAMFQLKIYPLPLCTTWEHYRAYELDYSIRNELGDHVKERCKCNFNSKSIHSGQFSCLSTICHSNCSHTPVTYRAIIDGSSDFLTADQLMDFMKEWHDSSSSLLVSKIQLKMARSDECQLSIGSFDEEEC